MSILRRIFLSLTRRPSRTLSLLLITALILIVFFSSIFIAYSCHFIKDNIADNLGQNYLLTYNDGRHNIKNVTGVIKKLNAYLDSGNLAFLEVNYSKEAKLDDGTDVLLYGVNSQEMYDVLNNDISIVSGRTFKHDEIENGSQVAIIPSSLKTKLSDTSKVIINGESFIVIGEYVPYVNRLNGKHFIYVPQKILDVEENDFPLHIKLKAATQGDNALIRIYLENTILVTSEEYDFDFSDETYARIEDDVNSLLRIAGIITISSFAIGAFIINFITLIMAKERRQEFIMLMKMGEKRMKIIFTNFLENLIVLFLATCIALVIALGIGKMYHDKLVQTAMAQNAFSQSYKTKEMYDFRLNADQFARIGTGFSLIVIVSLSAQSIYVARLKSD